jgi:hypothetical protein
MTKIALSIGIDNYDFASKLKNPLNDARDIKTNLVELGYDVILSENKDRIGLLRDINDFKKASKNADSSIIFYAGHGIQSNGINYLIPKDGNPTGENELDIFCIRINELIEQDSIENYKTNILIFDSCRDNPFERTWDRSIKSLGFAPILAPSGTLIAFSTSPGKTASDGNGNNGLYTEALLVEIAKPDLSIIQVFQNVRQKVLFYSNNQQLPWESTSLLGDFYFNSQTFNSSDARILFIRKIIAKVENESFRFSKEEYEAMEESSEGGVIYTNKLDGELKHIEKQLFFEMGRYFEDVYFNDSKPIYYRVTTHRYNVPMYITKESAEEMGTDYFNESKTTITTKEYFIENNLVIAYNKIEDKPPEKKTSINSDSILEQIKEIIKQTKN